MDAHSCPMLPLSSLTLPSLQQDALCLLGLHSTHVPSRPPRPHQQTVFGFRVTCERLGLLDLDLATENAYRSA